MDCSIGFIEAMMDKNEYDEALVREDMEAVYPALAKVFTPSLALATLQNLKRRLDRPEIYQLNDYHYDVNVLVQLPLRDFVKLC